MLAAHSIRDWQRGRHWVELTCRSAGFHGRGACLPPACGEAAPAALLAHTLRFGDGTLSTVLRVLRALGDPSSLSVRI